MVKDVTTRTRPKRYPVIIWLKKINLKSVHYHIEKIIYLQDLYFLCLNQSMLGT